MMTDQYTLAPRTVVAAPSKRYQQRRDAARHAAVDQGISVQSSFNTVCAVEYMKSHNIDPHIISRVLLHPEQRRRGGPARGE